MQHSWKTWKIHPSWLSGSGIRYELKNWLSFPSVWSTYWKNMESQRYPNQTKNRPLLCFNHPYSCICQWNMDNPATLLKKKLWQRCFPVNFVKFLRTRFLQKTSGLLSVWNEMPKKHTWYDPTSWNERIKHALNVGKTIIDIIR